MEQGSLNDLEANLLPPQNEIHPIDIEQMDVSPPPQQDVALIVEGIGLWEFSGRYNLLFLAFSFGKLAALGVAFMRVSCLDAKGIWMIVMTFFETYASVFVMIRLFTIFFLRRTLNNISRCLKKNLQNIQKNENARPNQDRAENQPEDLQNNIFYYNSFITKHRVSFFITRGILRMYDGVWPILTIWGILAFALTGQGSCSSATVDHVMLGILVLGVVWLTSPLLYKGFECICSPLLTVSLKLLFGGSKDPTPPYIDVSRIAVTNYSANLPENSGCTVCYVQFQAGDRIVQLDCNPSHYFHEVCGKRWLKAVGECPTCRREFASSSVL